MTDNSQVCCPEGYPADWHEKLLSWQGRLFVKDRVRSFLHIPLNFGGVITRNIRRIEAAGAMPEEFLVLCDENSLWGADMYIAVTKEVPGAKMASLSGDFLTKVYEGPYQKIPTWVADMKQYVAAQGKQLKQLYFLYKTCPKCAKLYGKNYVVLIAQV